MSWYNVKRDSLSHDSNSFYLLCLYLQKFDGRAHHEALGKESWTFQPARSSICCNQYRGDWESSLYASPSKAVRIWNQLFWQDSLEIIKQGLRLLQSAHWNGLSNLHQICGRFSDKIHLLIDYTNRPGEVADHWYTRDFDTVWKDIKKGFRGLFNLLVSE